MRRTIGKVLCGGPTGQLCLRADARFWSRNNIITACTDHDTEFAITVTRQPVITDAIEQTPTTTGSTSSTPIAAPRR